MPGTRVDIDVVVADRSIANRPDGRTFVEQFGVDAIAGCGLHAILALQFGDQFVARVQAVGLIGLDLEMAFQEIEGFVEYFTGDQDLFHLVFTF